MCNRYRNRQAKRIVEKLGARLFGDDAQFDFAQVKPTNQALVVRRQPKTGERQADLLRWDLIPAFWKKSLKEKPVMTNARSETVAEKPSFRVPFRRQRCLVPADGWFEWMPGNDPKGKKVPYQFQMDDREPFAFAGLYDVWKGPEGEDVRSFTIITTAASPATAFVHDRMPVVLEPEAWDVWLDPATEPDTLLPWLRPWAGDLKIEVVA